MKMKQSYEEMAARFLSWLENERMSSESLSRYKCWLREVIKVCRREDLQLTSESRDEVFSLLRKSSRNEYHLNGMILVTNRFIDFLEDKPFTIFHQNENDIVITAEFLEAKSRYLQNCRSLLRNSEYTIQRKNRYLSVFLSQCTADGVTSLKDFNQRVIHQESEKCPDQCNSFPVIQSFLQFLCKECMLEKDFSFALARKKVKRKIPTTYTIEEIRRMEEVIPKETPIGKRDKAMFLLCSRLGLRSSDVVNLRFSNLNFRDKTILLVQKKTDKEICLPMIDEIEESLLAYINVRPESQEKDMVFLRTKFPFRHITTSVLRYQLSRYMRLAGIDIEGKKHGPHALRSSLASSMINDGTPYETVKNILGHQDQSTLHHYALLDINRLRICALKPKQPSGMFALVLGGAQ